MTIILGGGSLWTGWSAVGDVSPIGVAGVGSSVWEAEPLGPITMADYMSCDATPDDLGIDRPSLGYDHRAWYVSAPTVATTLVPPPVFTDSLNNFFYIVTKPPTPFSVVQIGSESFRSSFNGQFLDCFRKSGVPGKEGREAAFAAIHHSDSPENHPPAAYFVGIALQRRDGQIFVPGACGEPLKGLLRLYAISDPLDELPIDNPDGDRELWFYDLAVPCFDPDTINVPDISGETFVGGDGRVTSAEWREVDGQQLLYVCHTITKSIPVESQMHTSLPQARVRWYVIDTRGWPDSGQSPLLQDFGEIDAGVVDVGDEDVEERPVHLVYPALASNEFGGLAFAMAQTSEAERLSIQVTGRIVTDPPGTVKPLALIRTSDQEGPIAGDEFGDYFGVASDSVDATFWAFGGYVSNVFDQVAQGYRWGTFFRHFGVQ